MERCAAKAGLAEHGDAPEDAPPSGFSVSQASVFLLAVSIVYGLLLAWLEERPSQPGPSLRPEFTILDHGFLLLASFPASVALCWVFEKDVGRFPLGAGARAAVILNALIVAAVLAVPDFFPLGSTFIVPVSGFLVLAGDRGSCMAARIVFPIYGVLFVGIARCSFVFAPPLEQLMGGGHCF